MRYSETVIRKAGLAACTGCGGRPWWLEDYDSGDRQGREVWNADGLRGGDRSEGRAHRIIQTSACGWASVLASGGPISLTHALSLVLHHPLWLPEEASGAIPGLEPEGTWGHRQLMACAGGHLSASEFLSGPSLHLTTATKWQGLGHLHELQSCWGLVTTEMG